MAATAAGVALHCATMLIITPRGKKTKTNIFDITQLPQKQLCNLETFLAGALYREFREFVRIRTTFLGKNKEIRRNSVFRPFCTNYDLFLWAFPGKSSEFA